MRVAEVEAGRGDPLWRETSDGQGLTLVATDAALGSPGVDAASGPTAAPTGAPAPGESQGPAEAPLPPASHPAALRGKVREGTKQAQLIAMLMRAEGATIAEIVEVTGWQPHTVRGALAGALKKRLGLDVASEKVEGAGGSTASTTDPTRTRDRRASLVRRSLFWVVISSPRT